MAGSLSDLKDNFSEQDIQQWFSRRAEKTVREMLGGWSRLKVIALMAAVLALDSADKMNIGAIAVALKHALHIGNFEIGLLVTVSTGIGALATLPMGILADRVHRVHLLTASMVLWSITMAISGFANSYIMLLATRLALGAVVAAAFPAIASLTGDFFRPGVRGSIWGYILSGELFGAGFGIIVSGEAATLFSWHVSFWILSVISMALAAAVWQWLPEPVRGGQSPLRLKEEEIPSTEELKEQSESNEDIDEDIGGEDKVEEEIEEGHIAPHQDKILEENPKKMPFWRAVRYIFSIRTNVLLIIASSLGYFFFTGVRTFAVVLMHNRFDISQGTSKLIVVVIGLGAIIGVLITGRTADRLIERGHISARVTVSAAAFLATSVLFLAGFFITSIYIASVLFFLASICLGGTNAPMDAARLDIMHSRLWGRAESVRTTLRLSFEAVAPILFGWVSTLLGGQTGTFGASSQNAQANNAAPLDHTFMIMLAPVIIAAFILYLARKPYPRDVATALASEKAAQDE